MTLLGLLANVNLDNRGAGQDGTLEDHVEGAEAASIQLEFSISNWMQSSTNLKRLYYAEQQERKRLEACLEEAHQDVTALYEARHKLEQTIAEQRVALLNAEKGEMGELESASAASSSSSPHVKVGRNENASGDATPAKKLRDEAIALRDKMRQMKQQGMEKESIVIDQIRTTLGEKESLHAELHKEIEDGKTMMALLEARCLNLTKERETAIKEKDDAVAEMAQQNAAAERGRGEGGFEDAVLARALERAERSEEEVTVLRKELEEARQAAKAAETDADRLRRLLAEAEESLERQGKGKAVEASSAGKELVALNISSASPQRVFLDASASSITSEHEFTQLGGDSLEKTLAQAEALRQVQAAWEEVRRKDDDLRVLSAAHDASVQRLEQQVRSLESQVAEGGGADKRRLKELSEKCVAAEVEVLRLQHRLDQVSTAAVSQSGWQVTSSPSSSYDVEQRQHASHQGLNQPNPWNAPSSSLSTPSSSPQRKPRSSPSTWRWEYASTPSVYPNSTTGAAGSHASISPMAAPLYPGQVPVAYKQVDVVVAAAPPLPPTYPHSASPSSSPSSQHHNQHQNQHLPPSTPVTQFSTRRRFATPPEAPNPNQNALLQNPSSSSNSAFSHGSPSAPPRPPSAPPRPPSASFSPNNAYGAPCGLSTISVPLAAAHSPLKAYTPFSSPDPKLQIQRPAYGQPYSIGFPPSPHLVAGAHQNRGVGFSSPQLPLRQWTSPISSVSHRSPGQGYVHYGSPQFSSFTSNAASGGGVYSTVMKGHAGSGIPSPAPVALFEHPVAQSRLGEVPSDSNASGSTYLLPDGSPTTKLSTAIQQWMPASIKARQLGRRS